MTEPDLRAEIEALRRELAAMRTERAGTAKAAEPEPDPQDAANFTDQLRALAGELSAFAEDTEKGIVNHPLTSVLGALMLGILIGRIIPR